MRPPHQIIRMLASLSISTYSIFSDKISIVETEFIDPWFDDPIVQVLVSGETSPKLHYALRVHTSTTTGGRSQRRDCLGVIRCSMCDYHLRPSSQLQQSQRDGRHGIECPILNRVGAPCAGRLEHINCGVRYTVLISDDDQPTSVRCNTRHEHPRPPVCGTQLSAEERARVSDIASRNPSATATELLRGTNPDPLASPENGGSLANINPSLGNPPTARRQLRGARQGSRQSGGNITGGGVSDRQAASDFQQNFPQNVLLNRERSIVDPMRLFIWVSSELREFFRHFEEAARLYGVGSTLCSDMTFRKLFESNLLSLTCYDYVICREIPLVVAFVPLRKDAEVYCEFWLSLFTAFPHLLVRSADDTWTFALAGVTVDFDPAQKAGFAIAIGRLILSRQGELPPPLSDVASWARHNARAQELGEVVVAACLRPCDFHYNQAVVREARKLDVARERTRFTQQCMDLKRLDLTLDQYHAIITDLLNTFPSKASWIAYWTRTALAKSIFPCLRTVELTVFLQHPTTISRTENIHATYADCCPGTNVAWRTFIPILTRIDNEFNQRRRLALQGEINITPASPHTMQNLPRGILSHGVLVRSPRSPPISEPLQTLPGRMDSDNSFLQLTLNIENAFPGADDLGGLQRVEV